MTAWGAALRSQDKICAEFAYHTFLDVPYASTFWKYIEAIENAGVTAGCQVGSYCPGSFVTRAQMALFLVRAIHGSNFVPPPASGTVYADVPASDSTAPYIEQLARDGVAYACQPGYYCPSNYMNRTDMSVFLERAKRGGGYTPPPASGTLFVDVPASYPLAAFIEQLYRDGITTGCATNPNRYCPRGLGLPRPDGRLPGPDVRAAAPLRTEDQGPKGHRDNRFSVLLSLKSLRSLASLVPAFPAVVRFAHDLTSILPPAA